MTIHTGEAYILRTCEPDMTSHGNFKWPREGHVFTPDWKPTASCGNGLHGFLWGEGDGRLANGNIPCVWLVAKIKEWVDLGGKVKFPEAWVEFTGSRKDAISFIKKKGATGPVVFDEVFSEKRAVSGDYGVTITGMCGTSITGYRGMATTGNWGKAVAGACGMATAGYKGIATAGGFGIASVGEGGVAAAGQEGTATAGLRGSTIAGDYGTATAGSRGKATAGRRGTATAGLHGAAIAGDYGTATVGNNGIAKVGFAGTAIAGYRGVACAGEKGILIIRWKGADTYVARVGENGIEPNTPYRLRGPNDFEKCDSLLQVRMLEDGMV